MILVDEFIKNVYYKNCSLLSEAMAKLLEIFQLIILMRAPQEEKSSGTAGNLVSTVQAFLMFEL